MPKITFNYFILYCSWYSVQFQFKKCIENSVILMWNYDVWSFYNRIDMQKLHKCFMAYLIMDTVFGNSVPQQFLYFWTSVYYT